MTATFDDLRDCLFVAVDAAIELRVPTLERAIRKLIKEVTYVAQHGEHMECDHCGRATPVKQLRRTPATAACFANNVCAACRTSLGWTDERLNTYWAKLSQQLLNIKTEAG